MGLTLGFYFVNFHFLLHENVQLFVVCVSHIGGLVPYYTEEAKGVYKIKKTGYIIGSSFCTQLIQKVARITYQSKLWKIWHAVISPGTCYYCASMNGRILSVDDPRIVEIPVHPNCRCYVEAMTAIAVGTATGAGKDGVDLYVALYGSLPNFYLTQDEAKERGWKKWLGNLADVLPGTRIGGDIYENRDHRLPEAIGRIWHEADFDYVRGYRNGCRLLYSNDGLLFVTYDHYLTFNEIGLEAIR